jgi:hypothetical protein
MTSFYRFNICHSEPGLIGEESAVRHALITVADCVMLARDEWVAVDLSDYAMQVE